MKVAALIHVAAAVALGAALSVSAAPVPHGLVQRSVTQLVDVKTQRRTLPDSFSATPSLQRREQQELVRRAGPNIFELGSKTLDNVGNAGRGGLHEGIAGLDGYGVDLVSALRNQEPTRYLRLLKHMRNIAPGGHPYPSSVTNLLHDTQNAPPGVFRGPKGTVHVQSGAYNWHLFVPKDVVLGLRPKDLQLIHENFLERMKIQAAEDPQGRSAEPPLHMHVHPGRQQTQAQAHQHPPTIEVPTSSSESSTLRPLRKHPSPIGAQAGPSTSYVNKGKGIMMEAPKSGNADYVQQNIHKRPWFDAFSDSTPRLGSAARPKTAPAFDKDLDTGRRPGRPEPDTELRLAPLTPAKTSERPLLQPEQGQWLEKKNDLALPNSKKQRQS